MPVCECCKTEKPEKAFRLWKKHLFLNPVLMSTCIWCEKMGKRKCTRCGKELAHWDTFKGAGRLFYCKKCNERTLAVIERMKMFKLELRINNLIKKLDRMPSNSIDGLREHLFATIQGLKDGTITPDVAAQITDVAKAIIDSARVENEFVQLTGSSGSGFIPLRENTLKQIGSTEPNPFATP